MFLGLPDVKPMQAAVMASLEQQAVRAVDGFAPDAMLKLWFTTLPQMSTQMQDMFTPHDDDRGAAQLSVLRPAMRWRQRLGMPKQEAECGISSIAAAWPP